MPTLLQSIEELINNITVTVRQEDNIRQSLSNIETPLKDKENNLNIERTFTNGSYDRYTIIIPLNEINMIAVLKFEDWKDEYGILPNPQVALTIIQNYQND